MIRKPEITDPDYLHELEQRFDGPVPAQYGRPSRGLTQQRGLLAGWEHQAQRWLDAAQRMEDEAAELSADDPEKMRDLIARTLAARDHHLELAADALRRAATIRGEMGLPANAILEAARLASREPSRD